MVYEIKSNGNGDPVKDLRLLLLRYGFNSLASYSLYQKDIQKVDIWMCSNGDIVTIVQTEKLNLAISSSDALEMCAKVYDAINKEEGTDCRMILLSPIIFEVGEHETPFNDASSYFASKRSHIESEPIEE